MRRIAVIGDIHGQIEELEELLALIKAEGVTEVWHVGDLVDRGPDSGAVVRKRLPGVMGNHESSIIARYESVKKQHKVRMDEDKDRTLSQLDEKDIEYLASLPRVHVFDDLKVVLVHGGLAPGLPLYRQNASCSHLQLIHPDFPGMTKWWNEDSNGVKEEVYRAQGWVRWYEVCDEPYLVVYGHSVFPRPFHYKNTLGIDTGGCFGNKLTAVILPDMRFLSVKSKKVYAVMARPIDFDVA